MRNSRLSTPVNKHIDDWFFHFNGKSLRFRINMKRPRDPEIKESAGGLINHVSFHAYPDRTHLKEQGIENPGFPLTAISDHDINKLLEKVKKVVAAAKGIIWERVILVAAAGKTHFGDDEQVRFAWTVARRSKDGVFFKRDDDNDSYVSRRASEILRGCSWDQKEDIAIHPYSEELEASLKSLDEKFELFTAKLKKLIKSPEALTAGGSNKLLPLTTEDQSVIDEHRATLKPEPKPGEIRL